jgi:hypothetical protein
MAKNALQGCCQGGCNANDPAAPSVRALDTRVTFSHNASNKIDKASMLGSRTVTVTRGPRENLKKTGELGVLIICNSSVPRVH